MPELAPATPAAPAAAPVAPPKPVVPPAPAPKPAAAQPTPSPAAPKPGVSPAPGASGDDSKMVPITALHEEREKRQALQAELEAMRKVAGPQMLFDINGNPVAQQHQQPNVHQVNPVQVELDKLWDTDPRKAVQMEINLAMNWYDQVNAQLDRQEMEIATKYPDFANYRNEVRGYVRSLPPEQRSNQGVVELAYYVVRGQKLDSIIERERAEMLRKIQAGESVGSLPPGSAAAPAVPTGQVQLTEEQRSACLALGLTEEEYAKWMNKK